ncbi:hypothetical protein MN608_08479 [Microdochium nivale]|nr:hypothetical protein MN608_08479 [Microdochium nivale]
MTGVPDALSDYLVDSGLSSMCSYLDIAASTTTTGTVTVDNRRAKMPFLCQYHHRPDLECRLHGKGG